MVLLDYSADELKSPRQRLHGLLHWIIAFLPAMLLAVLYMFVLVARAEIGYWPALPGTSASKIVGYELFRTIFAFLLTADIGSPILILVPNFLVDDRGYWRKGGFLPNLVFIVVFAAGLAVLVRDPGGLGSWASD